MRQSRLHKQDVQPKIPLYNPDIHKPGDVVRYNGMVITVPKVDADGYIYEE